MSIVGGGNALEKCVETAEAWLAALRSGDDRLLGASTALPFTHRSDGLKDSCDTVASDSTSLRRWAQCLRASGELRLAERDDWRTVRIYRGLPPARLTQLEYGLGGDGYWVQGFVSDARVSFGMAFLVVDGPGASSPRIRAFVLDASPSPEGAEPLLAGDDL
jgi:hypothetical protein